MEVIREELELIRDQFGDERRTEITANSADINIEDLIQPGKMWWSPCRIRGYVRSISR
ncbi:hypothetical protein LNP74_18195 [Klebsiella pneumoniae subsp. pneumoniae]|nr:hypothetical protein [Klebsiella pneumoniae subsp. pneumoniae]